MGRPRAVIVDDNESSRYLLRRVVELECDVVAEGTNGREAVVAADSLRPDVIVLDVSMPVMDGFEAAKQIRDRLPQVHIVFASQHTSRDYAEEAFRIGAKAYVVKAAANTELPEALRLALQGRCFRSPLTATQSPPAS